jgi:ADP-ribosylation factor related protein 1
LVCNAGPIAESNLKLCSRVRLIADHIVDDVLNSPRLLNLPLLLCANKQDSPNSLSVAEIRESFDAWNRAGSSSRAAGNDHGTSGSGADGDTKGKGKGKDEEDGAVWDDGGAREERLASLDVMGISALEG